MTQPVSSRVGRRAMVRASRHSIRATCRCNGFTLVELLLVLVLTSSLLGATIGLMSLVSRSHKQATQSLFQRQEIRRFADDLRRDVRSAETSALVDGKLILSYASPVREIVYSVQSASAVSRAIKGTKGTDAPLDHYRFGVLANIDVQSLDLTNAVQWTLTQSDRPGRPIQIIASPRLAP